jgi:hypothetical protein
MMDSTVISQQRCHMIASAVTSRWCNVDAMRQHCWSCGSAVNPATVPSLKLFKRQCHHLTDNICVAIVFPDFLLYLCIKQVRFCPTQHPVTSVFSWIKRSTGLCVCAFKYFQWLISICTRVFQNSFS